MITPHATLTVGQNSHLESHNRGDDDVLSALGIVVAVDVLNAMFAH